MNIFVHIPKTAGTSFRKSLDSFFKESNVAKDYGLFFEETNNDIKKYLHQNQDPYAAVSKIKEKDFKFIVGHFKASRYAYQIPVHDFVTILRDPVQRFYSEFQHRSNRHFDKFEGTIEDYCAVEKFCNVQSKMLAGAAWPAFGCVGLTESYNDSVRIINDTLSLDLKYMEVNKRRNDIAKGYSLTTAQIELIKQVNKADVELYEVAKQYFQERMSLDDDSLFVRGRLEFIKDNVVSGYAIPPLHNAQAVTVQVLANDHVIGEVIAKEHRKYLSLLGVNRNGYVGFEYDLGDIPVGAKISARVKETRQLLAYSISN